MAAISKTYGIGDTVYVRYPFPSSLGFAPQTRVISNVEILSATNEALVKFVSGDNVIDGAVQTIFATAALAATATIDDIISRSAVTCELDATTSVASTAGLNAVSLRRASA